MGAAGSQVNVQKLSLCPRNLLTPLSQGKLHLVSVLGYVCVCGGGCLLQDFSHHPPTLDGWVATAGSHSGTSLVVNRSLPRASSFYLCIWTLDRDPKLKPKLPPSCLLSSRLSYTIERGECRIFFKGQKYLAHPAASPPHPCSFVCTNGPQVHVAKTKGPQSQAITTVPTFAS